MTILDIVQTTFGGSEDHRLVVDLADSATFESRAVVPVGAESSSTECVVLVGGSKSDSLVGSDTVVVDRSCRYLILVELVGWNEVWIGSTDSETRQVCSDLIDCAICHDIAIDAVGTVREEDESIIKSWCEGAGIGIGGC